jgi:hypothetical protein
MGTDRHVAGECRTLTVTARGSMETYVDCFSFHRLCMAAPEMASLQFINLGLNMYAAFIAFLSECIAALQVCC